MIYMIEHTKIDEDLTPVERRKRLIELGNHIFTTQPRACGYLHEIGVAKRLEEMQSVFQELCSQEVRILNPACGHRPASPEQDGRRPDPYLYEASQARELGALTDREYSDLLLKLLDLRDNIRSGDAKAGRAATASLKSGEKYPLPMIKTDQEILVERLQWVKRYLLTHIRDKVRSMPKEPVDRVPEEGDAPSGEAAPHHSPLKV
jgi:hypothetical protein